jgi:hypothetical protein
LIGGVIEDRDAISPVVEEQNAVREGRYGGREIGREDREDEWVK